MSQSCRAFVISHGASPYAIEAVPAALTSVGASQPRGKPTQGEEATADAPVPPSCVGTVFAASSIPTAQLIGETAARILSSPIPRNAEFRAHGVHRCPRHARAAGIVPLRTRESRT